MVDTRPALPPLRDVIARHGLAASKSLGQNFLLDEQLLDRIAAIPGPLDGQPAFEVGPGPGGLTRAILRAGAHHRLRLLLCLRLAARSPGRDDGRSDPQLVPLRDFAALRLARRPRPGERRVD